MEPESQGYVNQDGPEQIPEVQVELPKLDLIDEAIMEAEAVMKRTVAKLNSTRPYLRVCEEGKAKFGGTFRLASWGNYVKFIWTVDVKDFRETAPIIEWLQDDCYLTCDSTVDQPTWGSGQREYNFSPFLQLEADLATDATCKRVVVGYEPVAPRPIYKFECPDEVQPDYHEGAGDV